MALAEHYRVHLGAFVDDDRDWQYAAHVREICADVCLLPLRPLGAKLRSLPAFLTGSPLTIRYYADGRMSRWIEELMRRRRCSRIVLYSSAMSQYAIGDGFESARRVIDFVDVDSDKWRQYAARRRGIMAWVYRREANRLLAYDSAVAREFDVSIFVSRPEADMFRCLAGVDRQPEYVLNGVDGSYYDPDIVYPTPFPPESKAVVFTGAMDYWANVDAVDWFAAQVWPLVRSREPAALFYIVGSQPGADVLALRGAGIVVTGRVADVRPYLRHAEVVVAPMQIARGIQNKVLEGMAMARPVVATTKAAEGIDALHGKGVLIADSAVDFADQVCDVLNGAHGGVGQAARDFVQRRFDWRSASARFRELVEGEPPSVTEPVWTGVR